FPPHLRRQVLMDGHVEQGSTVQDGMTDLDHTTESEQGLFIDLISSEHFSVVAKVTEEPAELPQGFRRAVDTTSDAASGHSLGQRVLVFLARDFVNNPG